MKQQNELNNLPDPADTSHQQLKKSNNYGVVYLRVFKQFQRDKVQASSPMDLSQNQSQEQIPIINTSITYDASLKQPGDTTLHSMVRNCNDSDVMVLFQELITNEDLKAMTLTVPQVRSI